MTWWTGRPNNNRSALQKLQDVRCISNYRQCITAVEQKIDAIPYDTSKRFCTKCIELKNDIIQRSNGLKQCYISSRLQPIEDTDKIKEFINKCPNLHKCQNPTVPPPKKPDRVRQTNEDSCRGNARCREKTVPAKSQKANSPGLVSQNPKSRSTEVQNSLQRNIGPSEEKVSSPKEPQTTPSTSSLGTQDDRSKSIVSKPYVNRETIETQMQPVPVQTPSPSSESDNPRRDLSSHSSLTGDSHSSSSPQVEDIKKDTSAADLHGNKNAGCSQHQEQCPHAQITPGIIDDHKDAVVGNSVNGSIVGKIITGQEHVDGQPQSRIEDTGGTITLSGNIASSDAVPDPQGGIGTGDDGGDHNHDTSHSQNSDHSNTLGVNTADSKSSGSEPAHSQAVVSDVSCSGTYCITRQGDELTDDGGDKLGIFNKIFSTIQANKDNVINTSIPVGIVLLLSLLFKYTPLWSFLTKRKRKKQSHMNEKLQRVLQQPSIGSEERSIPFSYSAFEYSS
ncbi:PIR protein [Plasmodium vivax]|nr:PIR protein [Plasmodium vivax]